MVTPRALRRSVFSLLLLAINLIWTGGLSAHQPGLSYINLTVESNRLSGRVDMSLRDLDLVVDLDADGNGAVTFGELQAKQPAIGQYLLTHLSFFSNNQKGIVKVRNHLVATDNDGAFAVAEIDVDFWETPSEVIIRNKLFIEADNSHRSLLQIGSDTNASQAIFSKEDSEQVFKINTSFPPQNETSVSVPLKIFFKEGIWHIWHGPDHILFLLALLLPSVLFRKQDGWEPVENPKPALVEVLWIVTSFTIAHSITLGLAAAELVQLPSRLVESIIAITVVLAAANNVRPYFRGKGWLVAFCCGIIHGFGFASQIDKLAMQQASFLTSLAGFNLGVEFGQLVIVAVFLPVAFTLRKTKFYQKGLLLVGSCLISVLALIWVVERVFDISLLADSQPVKNSISIQENTTGH